MFRLWKKNDRFKVSFDDELGNFVVTKKFEILYVGTEKKCQEYVKYHAKS